MQFEIANRVEDFFCVSAPVPDELSASGLQRANSTHSVVMHNFYKWSNLSISRTFAIWAYTTNKFLHRLPVNHSTELSW